MATKTAYHHGNLKPALVTAALRQIAAEGLEACSLRAVARRAGVSAPAVYRHFADKDALLAAVASQCAERLASAMNAAVAAAPPAPLEQFRATGVALVRFAVAHPEHFRVMSTPGVLAALPEPLRAGQDAFLARQRAMLAGAQARGELASHSLDALILAAHVSMAGLAHAIVEGRLGDIDDARATELAIAVTNVLGFGLLPRAATADRARDGSRRSRRRARTARSRARARGPR
ncbi:MAG: TetR/AcrR family transcriptional regulator [Acidobacteriota bacterium]